MEMKRLKGLKMELTGEQLLGVFAEYNAMIWPMQNLF